MPTCFVIQPFDNDKFDRRYDDTYEPALKAAGLEPYRVDRDPSVSMPIQSIERKIRESGICFADITMDNPNVWYELGFALACNRIVVMVCSDERPGDDFPFDVRHRHIIRYKTESESDFSKLGSEITARAKGLLERGTADISAESQTGISSIGATVPTELSPAEATLLRCVAGRVSIPGEHADASKIQQAANENGLSDIEFGVAIRDLKHRNFIDINYASVTLNDEGWDWIKNNEAKKNNAIEPYDDIPF